MAIHPIKIFYCYAHEDDALRKQLASHLSPLRRLKDITTWSGHDIQAGAEWKRESRKQLDTADVILLLISADFIASDYCYSVEMTRALERHKAGTACVIPILLRPVAWERTPIGGLSPLPTDRTPVIQWANSDAAWLNIVQEIGSIVRKLLAKQLLFLQDADILYTESGPLSGQIVGEKYLLGELIGEGAFSQVYKAQHIQIQRQQAVKVLLERHFRKQEFRDRFLREARTIASLDHPNIIHVDDFWVETSQAYLVMPYMRRGTLQDILEKQQGVLEQGQIVFYFEHICAALDYAHEQGIVHLDLKPLNLLVHENGRLLLSDFGLAHLMKGGAIAGGSSLKMGTPHYMAPEHIKGSPERRSDIFSLGVLLYQILLGRLPFDGLSHETILLKNITEWPPAPRTIRPELPQAVENVLGKALAKQPEQRYQTANDLLVAFKNALVTLHQVISLPPIIPTQPSKDENISPSASASPIKSPGPNVCSICIVEGNEPGRIYAFEKDVVVIGRAPSSDILLNHLTNREHASVLKMRNGNYVIRDEESIGGTFLNGQQLEKMKIYPLEDGDRIGIGEHTLIFCSQKSSIQRYLPNHCPVCGTGTRPGGKFCLNCGSPLQFAKIGRRTPLAQR